MLLYFKSSLDYLEYLTQCKFSIDSCNYNMNTTQIIVKEQQTQVLLLGTFWIFFPQILSIHSRLKLWMWNLWIQRADSMFKLNYPSQMPPNLLHHSYSQLMATPFIWGSQDQNLAIIPFLSPFPKAKHSPDVFSHEILLNLLFLSPRYFFIHAFITFHVDDLSDL